jgi:hypothetical protein
MSYPGVTATKFGRYHVAEPFRAGRQHLYRGTPLKPAHWTIPIPVLDQEDLLAQHIAVENLIPGARPGTDALGSCTANATTASVTELYQRAGRPLAGISISDGTTRYTAAAGSAAADETFAIVFYHECTSQTGDPAQEWPPSDCGSTGLYCCRELIRQGLISTYQTGTGGETLASMLQDGSVIIGSPWFNAWMEPGPSGFVDGDGSMDALQAAMNSGVAGGHETCAYQLPQITLTGAGRVSLQESWVQVRNSWSRSWGLDGDYRIHLSTLDWLAQSTDFKQFIL